MSRRVHVREGLFVAVRSDGHFVNGHENGPKMYIYPSVAIQRAGPGGSVFRVRSIGSMMTIERYNGPPIASNGD